MHRALLLLAVILVGACSGEAGGPPGASAPTPAAPPAPSTPAFVGRWAATPQLCADGAWNFRIDGVSTAGEVSCRFGEISVEASGSPARVVHVRARCTAEGAESDEAFTLLPGRGDPFQEMTVQGGPWAGPITLTRCPA